MHQNTCVRSIVKSHFYDLIVIGNDFSGLVTATLCAKRGLRVLIVQQECTTDPITPFPHGCDLTEQTIRELMIGHFLRDNLSTDVCSYQFISENTRINIYPDNNKLIRELSYVLENDEIHHLMNQVEQSTQSTQLINEMFKENSPWPKQGLFSNYEPGIDVTPFLLSEISPWSTLFFSAPLYAETNICPSHIPLIENFNIDNQSKTYINGGTWFPSEPPGLLHCFTYVSLLVDAPMTLCQWRGGEVHTVTPERDWYLSNTKN